MKSCDLLAVTSFLVLAMSTYAPSADACCRCRLRCCVAPCQTLVNSEFVVFEGGEDGMTFVFVESFRNERQALERVWQLQAEGFQAMYTEYYYDVPTDSIRTHKTIGPETVDRNGRLVTPTRRKDRGTAAPRPTNREPSRTWWNSQKTRYATATLLRVEEGRAYFLREDGRLVQCLITSLSESDQKYIGGHAMGISNQFQSAAR